MPMLELSDIREHLRIEEEDVSDKLLTAYWEGAISLFEARTGRLLFEGPDLPSDAPPNALLMNMDVLNALLMITAHRNENRGATSQVAEQIVPMGAQQIMEMHRWFYD
ncbi:hypothetical protein MC81_11730 [Achromobacter insolitus]|nr:hypothetical protein MC81_11730 [Achromobacter insolitus]